MYRIKIPATSANVGSGFDSLGIALDLYNIVYLDEAEGPEISSLDGTQVPTGEDNLIYKSAKYLFDLCGRKFTGLHIEQVNNIPMTRGLGSSSACIVAGLMGANTLMENPVPVDEMINIAANMEGHPDNSTPAIMGGLVTAVIDDSKVYYVKQEINTKIKFVAFIPDFELPTEVARGTLPKEVPHKIAVHNLSRAALTSVSLYSGKLENLRVGVNDRLHQPFRMSLIKGAQQVFDIAYDCGAYAAYISGAGSTLMAIVDEFDHGFLKKAQSALAKQGLSCYKMRELSVNNIGTTVRRVEKAGL